MSALERSVRRWRAAAIAASIIAGLLAIGFVAREAGRRSVPHEYVAILQKDAASPAFEVTVNLDRQELTVRPVAAQGPARQVLRTLDHRREARRAALARRDRREAARRDPFQLTIRAVVEDATYAVTVEPPGGSPDGKPSGPPVFVGKLIPVTP